MRVGSRPQIDAQAAAVGGRVLALDLLKECVRVGTTIASPRTCTGIPIIEYSQARA